MKNNKNLIPMTVTPATSSQAFVDELNALHRKAFAKGARVVSYGSPCDYVRANNDEQYLSEVRTKSWSFQVPDNNLGVMAVVRALGYGMSEVSPSDECQDAYEEYGIAWRKGKNGEDIMFCKKPTLILSADTCGFRVVWGGVHQAYADSGVTYGYAEDGAEEDDYSTEWTMELYKLRPRMKNGGCLVQSSSSSAAIKAEKSGNTWTITLTLPVLEKGQVVGMGYRNVFLDAYHWYCRQVKTAA